jgi:uncharacterized protein
MPPALDHPCLHLRVLAGLYFVHQLSPKEALDASILTRLRDGGAGLLSLTRTDEETSIVGEAAEADIEAKWKCIKIAGPMEFGPCIAVVCCL